MVSFAIGFGMLLSLLSSEFIGISAGGLVVPGYLSFFVDQPGRLAATFLLAIAVVGVIRVLERYLILFGRRRFMVTIMIGFVAGVLWQDVTLGRTELVEFYAIGLIIPGLLAYEMDRQGILPTTVITLIVAGLVRVGLWVVAS